MSNLPSYMSVEVVAAGEDALRKEFTGMEQRIQRTLARKALRPGAKRLIQAIRPYINSRTGLLAMSLGARAGRRDNPGITSTLISAVASAETVALHRAMAGRRSEAANISAKYRGRERARYKVYYARFVEFGHAGPYGSTKRTPPHPFMRSGFDAAVEETADEISETLMNGILNSE